MRWIPLLALAAACQSDEPADKPAPTETFNVRMTNVSQPGAVATSNGALDVKFAPGILVIHDDRFQLFEAGQPILFAGFENLVEDGDNAPLLAEIEGLDGVISANSFASLDDNYDNAPMMPGDSAILTEYATFEDGARLSVVAMYGESNDVFVGTPPEGVALFDGETPAYGELAAQLSFWDGGTEVNEEPGVGDFQPASQPAPGDGPAENGTVQDIVGTDVDGWPYPSAAEWVSVELYGEK